MNVFRSIKFNVVLFLIIAFLAAVGTFLPQTTDNADKVMLFLQQHEWIGRLLHSWGFFDIYHTFLFAALLGLMAFDVVVCKLWNKPPDKGLVPLPKIGSDEHEATLQSLRSKPFRLEGRIHEPADALARSLTNRLKSHRYSVKRVALAGGGTVLLASRHRLQRWGSYVSHISLVLILLGAMMKSLLGFETMLPVLEGRSSLVVDSLMTNLQPRPASAAEWHLWPKYLRDALQRKMLTPLENWQLWVDKLTVDFYHDNSKVPSTYASDVRLYNNAESLAKTTIRVNQPLDVNHVRFYQASWGVTGMIQKAILHVGGKTIERGMKESFPVPGQPWTARLEHYLPDFTIGEDGQPTTASLEWRNPVVVVGFYNKKQVRIGTMVLSAPNPASVDVTPPWGMFFFGGGHL